MAKALITESLLTNIASAIRAKAGTALTYTPAQMATAITNLPTGGGDEIGAIGGFIAGTYHFPSVATFNNITSIRNYGLVSITASTTRMVFPSVTSIGTYAFLNSNIGGLEFPVCTTIASCAFQGYNNDKLTFTGLRSIPQSAFTSAKFSTVTDSMFPSATVVQSSAFRYATITTVSLSQIVSAYQYAFGNCSALVSVSLPALKGTIGVGCFYSCTALQTLVLPEVNITVSNVFAYCYALSTLILPKVSKISSTYGFRNCYHLLSLYLLSTAVVSLVNANAFFSTPISTYTTSTGGVYGSIYVRASLLSAYQSASVWSAYSARFVGLTDAQISALGF